MSNDKITLEVARKFLKIILEEDITTVPKTNILKFESPEALASVVVENLIKQLCGVELTEDSMGVDNQRNNTKKITQVLEVLGKDADTIKEAEKDLCVYHLFLVSFYNGESSLVKLIWGSNTIMIPINVNAVMYPFNNERDLREAGNNKSYVDLCASAFTSEFISKYIDPSVKNNMYLDLFSKVTAKKLKLFRSSGQNEFLTVTYDAKFLSDDRYVPPPILFSLMFTKNLQPIFNDMVRCLVNGLPYNEESRYTVAPKYQERTISITRGQPQIDGGTTVMHYKNGSSLLDSIPVDFLLDCYDFMSFTKDELRESLENLRKVIKTIEVRLLGGHCEEKDVTMVGSFLKWLYKLEKSFDNVLTTKKDEDGVYFVRDVFYGFITSVYGVGVEIYEFFLKQLQIGGLEDGQEKGSET